MLLLVVEVGQVAGGGEVPLIVFFVEGLPEVLGWCDVILDFWQVHDTFFKIVEYVAPDTLDTLWLLLYAHLRPS